MIPRVPPQPPAVVTSTNRVDRTASDSKQQPAQPTFSSGRNECGDVVVSSPRRQQGTAASTAAVPSGGNLFTRFMKSSNGADVGASLPMTTATANALDHEPREAYRRDRPPPRRQIGILANDMPTLDMEALAHRVVPAVSLGSPRLVAGAPETIGEQKYDYAKHAVATTKVVERADAALGLRDHVNIVFYTTNPSALTSRRDFKLQVVPNHRDVREALVQQQAMKKQGMCASHSSGAAYFETEESSEDDDGGDGVGDGSGGSKKKKKKQQQRHYQTGSEANSPTASSATKIKTKPSSLRITVDENSTQPVSGSPRGSPRLQRAGGTVSQSTSGVSVAAGDAGVLHTLSQAKGMLCNCVHCNYVQDELTKFEEAMNPNRSRGGMSGGGSGTSQGSKASAASGRRINGGRNGGVEGAGAVESSLPFLAGPAFSVPQGNSGRMASGSAEAANANAVLSLTQQLLRLQNALAWLRQLEPRALNFLRVAVLTNFPKLLDDVVPLVSGTRARRITIAELFLAMGGGGGRCPVVAPVLRSTATEYQRFRLPERPIYGNSFLMKILPAKELPESASKAASAEDAGESSVLSTIPRTPSSVSRGSSSSPQNRAATMASHETLQLVRPWEKYFALFDSNHSGSCDKADLLLPMLIATSHVVPLGPPEYLKYDSRQASHARVVVSSLASMLAHRRATAADGPIRLGEVFAIRDFIANELVIAKEMAGREAAGIVSVATETGKKPAPSSSSGESFAVTPLAEASAKTFRALMHQWDATAQRMDEFRRAAEEMIARRELLDGPQLASLLQEAVLLG